MSKIDLDYGTPTGVPYYRAYIYFDDGDNPNADIEEHGIFTTEAEAWKAIKAALKTKPRRTPSEVEPGNTAVWCGLPERGVFTKDDDDDWFMDPSWERDDRYDTDAIYRD